MSEIIYSVKDLKFKYPKQSKLTLKGIDFDVYKGEIFGLLGPSGAGKSTTQKILVSLYKDYQGSVLYNGKELKNVSKEYLEDIGVGFELPVSYSKLTMRENLNFYKNLYKRTTNLDPIIKRLKLQDDMDKKLEEFSKGMKMRFNFIRALINKPKILFLDESTNGLDPVSANIMKDIIKEFAASGGTVFITTHLMSDVEQICDRAAFVVNGEIKEIASVRDLKLKYGKKELTVEYEGNTKVFDMNTIGDNSEFLSLLKSGKLETIHSGETSLEQIFIDVTGEKIG